LSEKEKFGNNKENRFILIFIRTFLFPKSDVDKELGIVPKSSSSGITALLKIFKNVRKL